MATVIVVMFSSLDLKVLFKAGWYRFPYLAGDDVKMQCPLYNPLFIGATANSSDLSLTVYLQRANQYCFYAAVEGCC